MAHLVAQEKEAQASAKVAEDQLQVAVEKGRRDAEELARVGKEHEALQQTVERIRRERQAARQERDLEAGRKAEAERVAAELAEELGHLQRQVQGLQAAVSQGVDRERQLQAHADGKDFVVFLFLLVPACCAVLIFLL